MSNPATWLKQNLCFRLQDPSGLNIGATFFPRWSFFLFCLQDSSPFSRVQFSTSRDFPWSLDLVACLDVEGLAEIFAPLYVQVFKKNFTAEGVKSTYCIWKMEKVIILQTGVYSGIRCFGARYWNCPVLWFLLLQFACSGAFNGALLLELYPG